MIGPRFIDADMAVTPMSDPSLRGRTPPSPSANGDDRRLRASAEGHGAAGIEYDAEKDLEGSLTELRS